MDTEESATGKVSAKEKDYVEVIKSDSPIDKKYIEEDGLPTRILYYCRQCEKPVTPKRVGKKLSFSCSECKKDPIAFGSEKSVQNYYKVHVAEK